jgi:transposase-like protein
MDDPDEDEGEERLSLNLGILESHFADESAAYQFVERIRWPNGPVCPHCGSVNHAYFLEPRNEARKTRTGKPTYRRVWKCGECRKQFSVLVGTRFEDSHLPLSKWLLAIHMLCATDGKVTAMDLQQRLGVAYRSAWLMAYRIRHAPQHSSLATMLKGMLEGDTPRPPVMIRQGRSHAAR